LHSFFRFSASIPAELRRDPRINFLLNS